ncbi:MAG TPA: hypothetical protein VK501_10835 [Baekduia sp.]|uniref:hypothetical protein n=1 Tax=Baekduia sp. TaxID=2600305 RepID=UPI002CE2142F|nr:hypothetical protein [Baekduia sp.]HMJ34401.1 hypothetical protein [Baekduia sp.]
MRLTACLIVLTCCLGSTIGCGGPSSEAASTTSSRAGSSAPPAPVDQARNVVEGIYGPSLRAWRNVFDRRWATRTRSRWSLRKVGPDHFVATLSIVARGQVRLRALWELNVPLDRQRATRHEDISAEFPDPVHPADAEARRLARLPLAETPPGDTYRLLAQLIDLTRDQETLQVSVHPTAQFPEELVTRSGSNDDALLRGLRAIQGRSLPVLAETRLSAATRFVQETARGSQEMERKPFLALLKKERPLVLLSWRFQQFPHQVGDFLQASLEEVRIPRTG